jgi:hypothetical protein
MTFHQSQIPAHGERERSSQAAAAPPEHPPIEPFDHKSGPALTARTVRQFLNWAAAVPNGEVKAIKQRIAAADDPKLVEALIHEISERPIQDVGLYLLLLSTIGELRDPRTQEALVSLIWEEGPLFDHPEPSGSVRHGDEHSRDDRSVLNFEAVVQSRAAEMLSYLGTHAAVRATLDVASKHSSSAVRFAAIDAHLFNHGDSSEAGAELRQLVRPDDVKMVGLPRFSRDMDPTEFDARVAAFYGRYPEELPSPEKLSSRLPTSRPWGPRPELNGKR